MPKIELPGRFVPSDPLMRALRRPGRARRGRRLEESGQPGMTTEYSALAVNPPPPTEGRGHKKASRHLASGCLFVVRAQARECAGAARRPRRCRRVSSATIFFTSETSLTVMSPVKVVE